MPKKVVLSKSQQRRKALEQMERPRTEQDKYIGELEDAVARLVRDWTERSLSPAVNALRELVEKHTGRDLEAEAESSNAR